MLALCWHIFRSWASFFRSCLLVGRLLLMLVIFLTFWDAPGLILECPGTILKGTKPHFSRFCRARRLAILTNCAFVKTTVFHRCFYGFYTSQALCSRHGTTQNRSWSLLNKASCKDYAKNASQGGFFEGLALSRASLGRLLFALGRLLASLGCFLGVSWALLAVSWLLCGASGPHVGSQNRPRPPFSRVWGRPRLGFEKLSKLF